MLPFLVFTLCSETAKALLLSYFDVSWCLCMCFVCLLVCNGDFKVCFLIVYVNKDIYYFGMLKNLGRQKYGSRVYFKIYNIHPRLQKKYFFFARQLLAYLFHIPETTCVLSFQCLALNERPK